MTVNVLVPTDGTLTLGGTDFICQMVGVVITSDQGEIITQSMCDTVTTYDKARYSLELDFLQDWTATTGISWYLFTNANSTVTYVWQPTGDGTPGMTGSVKVRDQWTFGGVAGQHARDRVRLACTAKPTLTPGS